MATVDVADMGGFASPGRNPLHPAPPTGDVTVTDLPVDENTFPWWKDHNIARYRQIRDARGRLLQQIYFDAQGRQVKNGDGIGSYLSRDFRNGEEQWVLDIDGELMLGQEGWSYSITFRKDNDDPTRCELYGLDGKPTEGNLGWAVAIFEYDARDRRTKETRYGADGRLVSGNGRWAIKTFEYDNPDGSVSHTCFDATNAKIPCPTPIFY